MLHVLKRIFKFMIFFCRDMVDIVLIILSKLVCDLDELRKQIFVKGAQPLGKAPGSRGALPPPPPTRGPAP